MDVRVRLGESISVPAEDRFCPGDGPARLRLSGVRLVVNSPHRDDWIWLEGVAILPDGRWGDPVQVMARAALLVSAGEGR